MNKVILMGRLTRTPEIRYSQGDESTKIARFSLAVDRRKGGEGTDFISCVAFGKLADFADKYLTKGIRVLCEGGWRTGSYTDKDGKKIYTNDCVLDIIEFTEPKGSGSQTQPQSQSEFDEHGFYPADDMDLPFV